LVIHHSASPTGSVEEFRREHKAKGWADIGYHDVIGNGHGMPDGHIGAGRPHNQVGAAVFGANTGKLHVCLVGNFHKEDTGYTGKPTFAQMAALGHWIVVNARRYKPHGRVMIVTDHRDAAIPGHPTACPGSEFPTHLVKGWFNQHGCFWAGNDHAVTSLQDYLKQAGYWK
jgi:hypothetical protein